MTNNFRDFNAHNRDEQKDRNFTWYDRYSGYVGSGGTTRVTTGGEDFSVAGYVFDTADNLWIEVQNVGGTISHLPDERAAQVIVGTGATDVYERQSKQAFLYAAGNEHRATFGAVPDLQPGAGFEVGIGDDRDRITFYVNREANGEYTAAVRILSNASGTPNDTIVPSNQWNIDSMDGKGKSGIEIDWSKGQMFGITYAWYGWLGVTFGLIIEREFEAIHFHSGANQETYPYIGNPSLPMSYKLWNNQATAGNSHLKLYGLHVEIDGTDPKLRPGFTRTARRTGLTVTNNPTSAYLVLAIRPKTNWKGVRNISRTFIRNMTIAGSAPGMWVIAVDPTIAAGTWTDVDSDSSYMEQLIDSSAAGDATNGIEIYSQAFDPDKGALSIAFPEIKDQFQPCSDYSMAPVIAVLFYAEGNGDVKATLNWSEAYL